MSGAASATVLLCKAANYTNEMAAGILVFRDEIVNGKAVRRRVSKWLAPINNDYRSKKDLQDLIRRELAPVNTGALPEGGLTFADFYEHHFLPHVQPPRRKASTFKFYRDVFRNHLRDRVGRIRLRDFTTAHAQGVLDSIRLSHQSLLRIKTAMSAAFTVADKKISSARPTRLRALRPRGSVQNSVGMPTRWPRSSTCWRYLMSQHARSWLLRLSLECAKGRFAAYAGRITRVRRCTPARRVAYVCG